jgi:hypothetical protein
VGAEISLAVVERCVPESVCSDGALSRRATRVPAQSRYRGGETEKGWHSTASGDIRESIHVRCHRCTLVAWTPPQARGVPCTQSPRWLRFMCNGEGVTGSAASKSGARCSTAAALTAPAPLRTSSRPWLLAHVRQGPSSAASHLWEAALRTLRLRIVATRATPLDIAGGPTLALWECMRSASQAGRFR